MKRAAVVFWLLFSFSLSSQEVIFPLFGYVQAKGVNAYQTDSKEWLCDFSTRFRLKGEWESSDILTARMEMLYQAEGGKEELVLDHAWAVISGNRFDLSCGKLPLAWGSAWLYNPTDRLGAPGGLADREAETAGTNALVPVWYSGGGWALEGTLVYPYSNRVTKLPWGLRIIGYAGGFDMALSLQRILGEGETYYAGLDTIGKAGPFGLYLETAFALEEAGADWSRGIDLSVGTEYSRGDYSFKAEYIHSSSGHSDPDHYSPDQLLAGQILFLAENYLFLSAGRTVGRLLDVSASGLYNLDDNSMILAGEAEYPVRENLETQLSLSVPLGPEGSEYRGEFDAGTGTLQDFMIPELTLSVKASF